MSECKKKFCHNYLVGGMCNNKCTAFFQAESADLRRQLKELQLKFESRSLWAETFKSACDLADKDRARLRKALEKITISPIGKVRLIAQQSLTDTLPDTDKQFASLLESWSGIQININTTPDELREAAQAILDNVKPGVVLIQRISDITFNTTNHSYDVPAAYIDKLKEAMDKHHGKTKPN